MIRLKRVYEKPEKQDGERILVERLWPRGLTKGEARVDEWVRDIAPSPELRKWFAHDPAKWQSFEKRYWSELRQKQDLVKMLKKKSKGHTLTLVYAARDETHNNAVALKEFIENRS